MSTRVSIYWKDAMVLVGIATATGFFAGLAAGLWLAT